MKARDVWNEVVKWSQEHPLMTELAAAFVLGFALGGLVFG